MESSAWKSAPNCSSSLARLKTLPAVGVMTKVAGECHLEYKLTDKGTALWPVVLSLLSWGDEFCAPDGPRRLFHHAADVAIVSKTNGSSQ
jgi:DNA-binding HxlR family transcriptional regulator